MSDAAKQVCFVDMPFGRKTDPKSRVEVDFDQIYDAGIAPAIARSGLRSIRGDQEETGGVIHRAMFARLLLSEYVVADMTTANPNVFYELGIRHTARPYTTIPIFATIGAPPFDVNLVRAIPYELVDGKLTAEAAEALIDAIAARISATRDGPVDKDSPLFELFPEFKGIEMSHELTDVFRDRVQYAAEWRDRLRKARKAEPTEEAKKALEGLQPKENDKKLEVLRRKAATKALREIELSLGDSILLERGVLIDLYLSYRAVEAWEEMIALYAAMPSSVQAVSIARQQLAFALNRRNDPGDRDRAVEVLKTLRQDEGESAETLGILGRIYKDRYNEAKETDPLLAAGWLEQAIEAYTQGFEAEPLDFYPGVNAITLLLRQGDASALAEADRLVPLVTFAAVRQGGPEANDYWTVATVIELACASRDYALAERCVPRAVTLASEPWMFKTTAANLHLIADVRVGEEGIGRVTKIAEAFEDRATRLGAG